MSKGDDRSNQRSVVKHRNLLLALFAVLAVLLVLFLVLHLTKGRKPEEEPEPVGTTKTTEAPWETPASTALVTTELPAREEATSTEAPTTTTEATMQTAVKTTAPYSYSVTTDSEVTAVGEILVIVRIKTNDGYKGNYKVTYSGAEMTFNDKLGEYWIKTKTLSDKNYKGKVKVTRP